MLPDLGQSSMPYETLVGTCLLLLTGEKQIYFNCVIQHKKSTQK